MAITARHGCAYNRTHGQRIGERKYQTGLEKLARLEEIVIVGIGVSNTAATMVRLAIRRGYSGRVRRRRGHGPDRFE
jgi:hypothetical protein